MITNPHENIVKAGFAKECLNSALPQDRPVREDIEAGIVYFSDKQTECCWAVLDFMDFGRKAIDHIKHKITKISGIKPQHVHILTTHNHGASTDNELNIDDISEKVAAGVLSAKNKAVEASMRYALVKVQEQLNYVRRLFVDEMAGKTTFYFGPCPENNYEITPFLKNSIYNLEHNKYVSYSGTCEEAVELKKQYTSFPSADNKLQIILFEKTDGTPIGSICRFAAHVVCCNSADYYTSDYPYYVRQVLQEKLGGVAVFMNGPCADISPGIVNKKSGGEKFIGEKLAELAAEKIKTAKSETISSLADYTEEVMMPVRPDLLQNQTNADELAQVKQTIENEKSIPLPELKKLAERVRFFNTGDFLRSKWLSTEKEIEEQKMSVEARIGRLVLNDLSLLAFPGETFSATAQKVCVQSDSERIISVTEHDRTLMYIVPDDEYDQGGYEPSCCMVTPAAEAVLVESAVKLMK